MHVLFRKTQLTFFSAMYIVVMALAVFDAKVPLSAVRWPFSFLLKPVLAVEYVFETQLSHPLTRIHTLLNAQEMVADLQNRNNELRAMIAQAEFTQEENKALKMEIEKGSTETLVKANHVKEANIFSEGVDAYIDRGTEAQIEAGDLVFSSGVLIGKVQSVEAFFSRVSLFSQGSWQLVAETQNGVNGIVTGARGSVKLTQIPADKKIEVGDAVFTTGSLGEGTSAGMLIGQIKRVEQDVGAAVQTATIDQIISPDQLRVVRIVRFR